MRGSSSGFGDLKKLQQAARKAREQARAEEDARRREAAPAQAGPDESRLFRQAMQAVTPLKGGGKAVHRAHAAPSPEQLEKRRAALGEPAAPTAAPVSDHYAPRLDTDLGTAWFAPDMAADTPRRLQRGQWRIEARVDLHGMRTDAAREALLSFLADCVAHRVRCARVIHGKGYGSAGAEPVLREKVPAWLMQYADVCAFVQAAPAEGGEGALVVLLRQKAALPHG